MSVAKCSISSVFLAVNFIFWLIVAWAVFLGDGIGCDCEQQDVTHMLHVAPVTSDAFDMRCYFVPDTP